MRVKAQASSILTLVISYERSVMRKRDNDENKLQNEPADQNFTSPCWQSSAAFGEGWGGGLGARRGADVPEAMARSVQISGELELVGDARRLPKGLEARAGRGQSPPEHAGDATPRGCGRCKCQPGESTGAASGKQIGYMKIALQMRSFLGRRLASRAGVRGFLIPLLSMDAVRSSTTWGKWPGAWSCPPAVPLPSQQLPQIPVRCLLPVPWLLQLLHVQALRFLLFY